MMPAKFADGSSTYKFDKESNYITTQRVDGVTEQFTRDIEQLKSFTYEYKQYNDNNIELLRHNFLTLDRKYMDMSAIVLIFINTKFFRFINNFGCWFVFSNKPVTKYFNNPGNLIRSHEVYNVYINTLKDYDTFKKLGFKIPLMTRIKHFFIGG